jgi:hypothetical protein
MGHCHILYAGMRTIIKLFRNTDLKIAFRTINTIKNHLKPREITVDMCNQSGVYQLKCNEYPLKYFRQSRYMSKVYNIRNISKTIRTNKQNSKYAQHILNIEKED